MIHTCKTEGCNRLVHDRYVYCSIECCCYDQYFIRKNGKIIINKKKVKELDKYLDARYL